MKNLLLFVLALIANVTVSAQQTLPDATLVADGDIVEYTTGGSDIWSKIFVPKDHRLRITCLEGLCLDARLYAEDSDGTGLSEGYSINIADSTYSCRSGMMENTETSNVFDSDTYVYVNVSLMEKPLLRLAYSVEKKKAVKPEKSREIAYGSVISGNDGTAADGNIMAYRLKTVPGKVAVIKCISGTMYGIAYKDDRNNGINLLKLGAGASGKATMTQGSDSLFIEIFQSSDDLSFTVTCEEVEQGTVTDKPIPVTFGTEVAQPEKYAGVAMFYSLDIESGNTVTVTCSEGEVSCMVSLKKEGKYETLAFFNAGPDNPGVFNTDQTGTYLINMQSETALRFTLTSAPSPAGSSASSAIEMAAGQTAMVGKTWAGMGNPGSLWYKVNLKKGETFYFDPTADALYAKYRYVPADGSKPREESVYDTFSPFTAYDGDGTLYIRFNGAMEDTVKLTPRVVRLPATYAEDALPLSFGGTVTLSPRIDFTPENGRCYAMNVRKGQLVRLKCLSGEVRTDFFMLRDGETEPSEIASYVYLQGPEEDADEPEEVTRIMPADGTLILKVVKQPTWSETAFTVSEEEAPTVIADVDNDDNFKPTDGEARFVLRRRFVKGWNQLCLPFNISTDELSETLGAGRIATLDNFFLYAKADTMLNVHFTTLDACSRETMRAYTPFIFCLDEEPAVSDYDFGVRDVTYKPSSVDCNDYIDNDVALFLANAGLYTRPVTCLVISGDGFKIHQPSAGTYNLRPLGCGMYLYDKEREGDFTKRMRVFIDGEMLQDSVADGVTDIQAAPSRVSGSAVYNLSGQRLAAPVKGVNITDGGKFIVR